jgi:hypothetical protein
VTHRRLAGLVVALLAAFACGGSPWSVKGAPGVPPDEQFRTGVEAGEDVYIWHCYRGSRVVVHQFGSACFGTRAPQMDEGPCGAPLPVEANYQPYERDGGAQSMPDDMRWPGTSDGGS